MRILRPGAEPGMRKNDMPHLRKFKCDNCGCKFIAECGEYVSIQVKHDINYVVGCPNCGYTISRWHGTMDDIDDLIARLRGRRGRTL